MNLEPTGIGITELTAIKTELTYWLTHPSKSLSLSPSLSFFFFRAWKWWKCVFFWSWSWAPQGLRSQATTLLWLTTVGRLIHHQHQVVELLQVLHILLLLDLLILLGQSICRMCYNGRACQLCCSDCKIWSSSLSLFSYAIMSEIMSIFHLSGATYCF